MRESLWLVVVLAAGAALGQDFSECDLYQELAEGASYTIKTPFYPNYFYGAYACRWNTVTDPSTKIELNCEPDMPAMGQCDTARLSMSWSGDVSLSDAEVYCGEGAFSLVSDANRLVFALHTTDANGGSRLACTVTAVQQQPPPADCTCGVKNKNQTRIVNGKETGVNEYPLMAGLVDLDRERPVCGASIISQRHAVTAAHCLTPYTVQQLGLLVGDHNISTGADTDKAALYRLQQLVPHPDFLDATHLNDIGVVRVAGHITYNVAVGPVCLPFLYTYTDFLGISVQALGWGRTSVDGPASDVLMEANLTVVQPTRCTSNPAKADYIICTFGNGTDACQGDSGGPLLWQDPYSMRLQLVGIISHGSSCAVSPATNMRVTAYLKWIAQVTQDAFCIV